MTLPVGSTTYAVTARVAVAALWDTAPMVTRRRIRTWVADGSLAPVGRGPRGVYLFDLTHIVALARATMLDKTHPGCHSGPGVVRPKPVNR